MQYQTKVERFAKGEYPLVCVRSGRVDGVELRRAVASPAPRWWTEYFFWPFDRIVEKLLDGKSPQAHGLLPYAPGELDIEATFSPKLGIVIENAHPGFVNATKAQQGRL